MIERMRNELYPVCLIARRELIDQFRDWRIVFPIFGLTIFFPILMNLAAKAAVNFTTKYDAALVGERFVPFLLMVVGFFPITVSLVVALESFVGEKERGTIEPLLSSPIKDWQLFVGKMTASVGSPLVASYLGIIVYLIGLRLQGVALPDGNRLAQTIVLTTVQAVLMVSGAILISTQVTSVRAANLMASFIVIPIALLIQGESVLMFWGTNQVLWLAVAAVSILTLLLVRMALAHFQREMLLGREIDLLNLRWIRMTFWHSFRGTARSVASWYRDEIPRTLRKISTAIAITLLGGIITSVVGYIWINSPDAENIITHASINDLANSLSGGVDLPGTAIFFYSILWHNLRAVLVISVFGIFSFGVLGFIMYLMNMGLIGLVIGLVSDFGLSPITVTVFGLLPHGIFEIPALILSSASILYIGVLLVTPAVEKTLGETIIDGLAYWARVMIGIVLPLLLIAAFVETWVTPVLLNSAIK